MRTPQTVIADELDALFRQCKDLLEEKPFQEDTFVNALFKLRDLRSELIKMIGEQEALTITSRAYHKVFPSAFLRG